ncbi:MAG: 4Fe-4S dicluster domain-containing protein [Desulfovibrionaceae bacterium]|nr:4Fe-4S dicluster domain-containing protein [Desulfovibrionaceae bacterium]
MERTGSLTRRGFLGGSLVAAIALGSPHEALSAEKSDFRPAMIINLNRCIGCQSCTIACRAIHPDQPYFLTRVEVSEHTKEVRSMFRPHNCNHCKDPSCLQACSHKAIVKGRDGIVRIDKARCNGCGACVTACPFGEIFLNKDRAQAIKCEFCQGERGLPACVEACASKARLFGDTLHPKGEFAKALHQARLEALDADFQDKLSGTCYVEVRS